MYIVKQTIYFNRNNGDIPELHFSMEEEDKSYAEMSNWTGTITVTEILLVHPIYRMIFDAKR